jgi:hypothetical protein
MLKPQDVLIACKLLSLGDARWTFSRLASSLSISVSESHEATERCKKAAVLATSKSRLFVVKRKFFELLTLAVPQIFYAVRGPIQMGTPTSVWAGPLASRFTSATWPRGSGGDIPLVWPHEGGTVRGESLLPIYPTVPKIVGSDLALYEMLALIDVIRTAEIPDRKLAATMLEKIIWKDD